MELICLTIGVPVVLPVMCHAPTRGKIGPQVLELVSYSYRYSHSYGKRRSRQDVSLGERLTKMENLLDKVRQSRGDCFIWC